MKKPRHKAGFLNELGSLYNRSWAGNHMVGGTHNFHYPVHTLNSSLVSLLYL